MGKVTLEFKSVSQPITSKKTLQQQQWEHAHCIISF